MKYTDEQLNAMTEAELRALIQHESELLQRRALRTAAFIRQLDAEHPEHHDAMREAEAKLVDLAADAVEIRDEYARATTGQTNQEGTE
jgi:hypothetical protein